MPGWRGSAPRSSCLEQSASLLSKPLVASPIGLVRPSARTSGFAFLRRTMKVWNALGVGWVVLLALVGCGGDDTGGGAGGEGGAGGSGGLSLDTVCADYCSDYASLVKNLRCSLGMTQKDCVVECKSATGKSP